MPSLDSLPEKRLNSSLQPNPTHNVKHGLNGTSAIDPAPAAAPFAAVTYKLVSQSLILVQNHALKQKTRSTRAKLRELGEEVSDYDGGDQ